MASKFKIAYVERGYENAWRDFWVNGHRSAETMKAHAAGKLGQTEIIEAKSMNDAMTKVRAKFPDHVIMPDGSSRIGG